ncbi:interferon lambda-2-like [Acomys russatus]|uniref:interferon lambda-2-like n=1 Tax=Acomys russatus TaxID=60746 RepID=UPI0021E201A9|nr:interferon lambda-2-like [Acomys russatus]
MTSMSTYKGMISLESARRRHASTQGSGEFKHSPGLQTLLAVSLANLLFFTSPQVQERPKALQAELALTLTVLENMTDSAPGTTLDQPLHTLRHIHTQLHTCMQPQPPAAEPRSPSRRLSRWLLRLQEAQRKESPGCLEDSVTFNLFHLLFKNTEYSGPAQPIQESL